MKYVAYIFIIGGILTVMGAVGNDDFHHIELVKAGEFVAEEAPSLFQTLMLSVSGLLAMGIGALLLNKTEA